MLEKLKDLNFFNKIKFEILFEEGLIDILQI